MVILDLVMPEMAGREAYRRIREINPNVVALLTSGYAVDGGAQHVLDDGIDALLQKPFRIAKLSGKLAELL